MPTDRTFAMPDDKQSSITHRFATIRDKHSHGQQDEILKTISENNCCSQSFICAILKSLSSIDINKSAILIKASKSIISKATKIMSNMYPEVDICIWDDFLMLSGNIYNLLLDTNITVENNIINAEFSAFPNECDKLCLIKTFFITNGSFYYNADNNSKSKGYNLEYVFKDDKTATFCMKTMLSFDLDFKKTIRQNNHIIYTKNSNTIFDTFVKFGAISTALDIQNNLAIRDIRNTTNRENNCFEYNLDKTLTASTEQIHAIEYILDNYSLDYLDESLRIVALTRLTNPDVSLKDLQTLLGNTISRTGIKYRLDKIISIYRYLKGEN